MTRLLSVAVAVFALTGLWKATGYEAGLSAREVSAAVPMTSRAESPRWPTPAAQAGAHSNRSVAERAIRQVFGARAPAAIRVARCETGGTFYARAVGRHGERGLFQIHPVHFSWAQPSRLFDPVWNSRVAYRLSRGGTSWRAWSCRP